MPVNWDRVYEVYRWWVNDARGDPDRLREHPHLMGPAEWQLLDQIVQEHGTGFRPAFDYRAQQKSGASRDALNRFNPSSVGLSGGWEPGLARTNYEVEAGIHDYSGGNVSLSGSSGGSGGFGNLGGLGGISYGPDELPEGYEIGYGYGGGQYPLYSARGPGLAAPFDVAFQAPDPRELAGIPAYDFVRDEGMGAITDSAGSKGTLLSSGNTLAALADWNEGLASTQYPNIYNRALGEYAQAYDIFQGNNNTLYNRLAGLAGTSPNVSGQIGSMSGNYANAAGGLITGGGNAAAAGIVGAQQAWNPLYGSLANLANTGLNAWFNRGA